jgi:[ribosomal protein S5]-alanine N-acetyltransferase
VALVDPPQGDAERLIGVISLMDNPDDNRGFWLDPDFWRQGLMSEACPAVTEYWFQTLERPVLREHKAAANQPSRRISERSGMRLIETAERAYVSGRLPGELWEITREEWRRWGQPSTALNRAQEGDPT